MKLSHVGIKLKSFINKSKKLKIRTNSFFQKQKLINKINSTEIKYEPFPHLIVDNFFEDGVFKKIINSKILTVKGDSDEELLDNLSSKGWNTIMFPGCTVEKSAYLEYRKSGKIGDNTPEMCEGFGMALRLERNQDEFLDEYIKFFNSEEFINSIANKFNIPRTNKETVDSGLQKYLDGYEISPHPDIRKKLLTFMINVNTNINSEEVNHHTHLLNLRKEYLNINKFWEENPLSDRTWLPWDWCETSFLHKQNNSLIAFPPCNESIHAVKAIYNHLNDQRTQFYGNLWLEKSPCNSMPDHKYLEKICQK